MHTKDIVNKAKELKNNGLNLSKISKELNVSRSTLREWISNKKRYIATIEKPRYNDFFDRFETSHEFRKQYYYLLGQYLGDGYILLNIRTYRLRISATSKYINIIDEIKNSINTIFPNNSVFSVNRGRCNEIIVCSNYLPEIFPHLGKGKKHERKIELTDWQLKYLEENSKELARGLFQSDGCYYLNHKTKNIKKQHYYIFTNCSLDIHRIYQKCLEFNDINYTFNKKTVNINNSEAWSTIMYKKEDVKNAYEFLGEKS